MLSIGSLVRKVGWGVYDDSPTSYIKSIHASSLNYYKIYVNHSKHQVDGRVLFSVDVDDGTVVIGESGLF